MSQDSELSYIFSLCDVGQKGFITSEDILKVGSEYGPELSTILSILRLGDGDRLRLEEFISRVNESESTHHGSNEANYSPLEEQELSCISCPPSDYTSGFGSPLSDVEDEEGFDNLDVSDVRYALRKLEISLSVMKESQVDTKQDLALILESVTQLDRKEGNRRRIEKEHELQMEKIRLKFESELNRQKEYYCHRLDEKIKEMNDIKKRLSQIVDEHSKEKELLASEVESLKLVNVVLEQKLEFLKDSDYRENDEINRQWRQIQLDKDRLEDEKIEFGFQKLCLVTDSEDLQLEKKEFNRSLRSSKPIDWEELHPHLGMIQSDNDNLRLSFEESELSNRELKRVNVDLQTELASAKTEILDIKKKMDPLSLKNGLIGQFRDTLQRKKDSKKSYTDLLNAERQAYLEKERELIKRNEDLSLQLSKCRRRRSGNDWKKSPPPKCLITEKDKEVNKQIFFEKKCLSLIIDDLKSANQSLTDNLRILEKENKEFRLQTENEDKDLSSVSTTYIQNINPRPRVFSSTSLKSSKDPDRKLPPFSKSMSSLNIY